MNSNESLDYYHGSLGGCNMLDVFFIGSYDTQRLQKEANNWDPTACVG